MPPVKPLLQRPHRASSHFTPRHAYAAQSGTHGEAEKLNIVGTEHCQVMGNAQSETLAAIQDACGGSIIAGKKGQPVSARRQAIGPSDSYPRGAVDSRAPCRSPA